MIFLRDWKLAPAERGKRQKMISMGERPKYTSVVSFVGIRKSGGIWTPRSGGKSGGCSGGIFRPLNLGIFHSKWPDTSQRRFEEHLQKKTLERK